MNKVYILICLLAVLTFSCKNSSNKRLNNRAVSFSDSLTKELNEIYSKGYINGFSVAIVDQDKTVYLKGFGYADIDAKKEYLEHTIQNIASISKTFIGIALLKAQEMGKLKLDDPVNDYLSFDVINPYHPEQNITIRHLATHTSGIKDTELYSDKSYILKDIEITKKELELYVSLNNPELYMPMIDYLRMVLSTDGKWYKKEGFLKSNVGERFEYSNIGATLAAVVLEIATGESFNKFTSDYILKPLKMSSSGWFFEDIEMSMYTKLYLDPETEIPYYKLITYPDGGLITSANDLSKYLIELINGYLGKGILLNKKSYEEFFTKQLNSDHFDENYEGNEGVFVSFEPNGLIGHSGGDPGVSTYMFFDPKTKSGSILLVNTDFESEGVKQYKMILNCLKKYEAKLK